MTTASAAITHPGRRTTSDAAVSTRTVGHLGRRRRMMDDVHRGGWSEMFGPRPWRAGSRAALRGHRIGRKVGDGWTLPVWLVVHGESAIWRWDGRRGTVELLEPATAP